MSVTKGMYISKPLYFGDWLLLIVLTANELCRCREAQEMSCARNSICSLLYELDTTKIPTW